MLRLQAAEEAVAPRVPRTRGTGSVYLATYRAKDGAKKTGRTYVIQYYARGGQLVKEHTHLRNPVAAERLLRKRLAAVDEGAPVGSEVDRTTLHDLVTFLLDDYRANGRKSTKRAVISVGHLERMLGEKTLARDIDETTITSYVARRQDEGAAVGTINRELSALRRAFRLAARARRVSRRPDVSQLTERNARQGFFEDEQYEALLAHLDDDVRPVVQVAYLTGWRTASEILTRQWRHVDLDAGWLRIEPGEAKHAPEGRMFPLDEELRAVLEAQRKRTTALERKQGAVIPWVFHRAGRPIRYFRRSWLAACLAAGLATELKDDDGKVVKVIAQRIPHDFRRTAARNLERAAVSRSAAMAMIGHKTESMYRRYAIVDEAMLQEAAVKLSAARAGAKAAVAARAKKKRGRKR